MKLIIAGSRDFNNYNLLVNVCSKIKTNIKDIELVSGSCPSGADSLGEKWAKKNNIPIKRFPAKWNLYGKKAGPLRNGEMARYADCLLAFWDGKSAGTKNMIELAEFNNLKIKVIKY
jgi:hypothetical protein